MATDDEYLPSKVLRHGTYVCLKFSPGTDPAVLARAEIPALAKHLHLENEFAGPPPNESIAFLRRHAATLGAIPDEGVSQADCVIHVAARSPRTIRSFCLGARRLLQPFADFRILEGVVRPRTYSGAAMEHWAYARAVAQLHGSVMPNAFLIPMSKTSDWWTKDWLERSTYFLPRYDTKGRMVAEGHALAGEAGILCIMRRTYQALRQPAPIGSYDFLAYFECADIDTPVFEKICANLRDVRRNPEWEFVREGPTWHGRRVATWPELFEM